MTPDLLFQLANPLALLGWLALALSPWSPRVTQMAAAILIPLVLSVGYTAVMLAHWSSGNGDFNSLNGVAALFENRWLLLAGWVHYLAFDLLIGAWEARTARREGMTHLLLLPCLLATFLFGPAGYLMFQALRASRRKAVAA
ncbi:MAG: DUF4281 domain-containing protein [Betaproteobacteria bacterium]|nr:DUF4281 domain-containing protein [Betaproteobacteria bacterium]